MAGESIRDLKRRIKSVQSTRQITKAMEMVAASKLRRAPARLVAARPYDAKMRHLLANVAAAAGDVEHPLLQQPGASSRRTTTGAGCTGIVIFTADRGLCGSYSANIVRTAELRLRAMAPDTMRLVVVGKKGLDYFRRRRYPLVGRFPGVMGGLSVPAAEEIARAATDLFLSGEVGEVEILYTMYVSTMTYRVTWDRLLPVASPVSAAGAGGAPGAGASRSAHSAHDAGSAAADYLFEPDGATILAALLPRYVPTRVLMAMAEAQTAEQGSRMISMGAATRNASELIDDLVLKRNRARQAAITKELAEIVGGAEALR